MLLPSLRSFEEKWERGAQTFIVPDAATVRPRPVAFSNFVPLPRSEFPLPVSHPWQVNACSPSESNPLRATSLLAVLFFHPPLSFCFTSFEEVLFLFEKLYLHRREAREYREILASPLGGRIHSSEGEAMAWSCRWPSNTVAQYPIIKLAGCYTALSFQYPPRLLIRVILHVAERVKGRIG